MRLRFWVLPLLGLLSATAPVQAADSFDYLQKFCLATRADPKAALALADGAGWLPVTQAVMDRANPGRASWAKDRMFKDASGTAYVLSLGTGDPEADPTATTRICAVAALPAEPAALERAAVWAAVAPDTCNASACFTWREENGRHIRLEKRDVAGSAFSSDMSTTILMTRAQSNASSVLIVVPAPALSPSQSSRSLDLAQQLCFATRGDPAKALDLADRTGWLPMPDALLQRFGTSRFGPPMGRVLSDGSEHYSLLVTKGDPPPGAPIHARACILIASPSEPKALDRLRETVAVPPQPSCGNQPCYAWRDEGDSRIALDRPATNAALEAHDSSLNFITTTLDQRLSMIVFMVPTP